MEVSGGPSYVHGANSLPLLGLTIGQCLDQAAASVPDGEALVIGWQNIRWTWRELKARADEFAAGLIALGLEPGDRLGIWAPNNAELDLP